MKEKELLNRTLLDLPPNCRLFRNNVGKTWTGQLVDRKNTPNNGVVVVIKNARPFHAGLVKGSSDLIGWTRVTITPEMVGKEVAIFTAMEAKTGNTAVSKEQKNFMAQVKNAGGIASIFRTVARAVQIIKERG